VPRRPSVARLRRVGSRVRRRARVAALELGVLPYRTEPWTPEEWQARYGSGHLDYFAGLDELSRYSLLLGYLTVIGGEPEVLDVGCGQGLLRARMGALPMSRYVGIDPTPAAIDQAAALVDEKTTFRVGDITDRGLDLGTFDVVVCNEVLSVVEDRLGIDVVCEPVPGGPLGMSAAVGDTRLVLLNTAQDQRKMTFTLAHELGHLLADAHAPLCVTRTLSSSDARERFANTFASCVLAPAAELRRRLPAGQAGAPDALVAAFLELGMSWQALVYRLHNAGIVNAVGRDALLAEGVWQLAQRCKDAGLRDQVQRDDRGPTFAYRPPRLLTQRCAQGYLSGVVSIRPYAGLVRMDEDDAAEQLDAASA